MAGVEQRNACLAYAAQVNGLNSRTVEWSMHCHNSLTWLIRWYAGVNVTWTLYVSDVLSFGL